MPVGDGFDEWLRKHYFGEDAQLKKPKPIFIRPKVQDEPGLVVANPFEIFQFNFEPVKKDDEEELEIIKVGKCPARAGNRPHSFVLDGQRYSCCVWCRYSPPSDKDFETDDDGSLENVD